MAYSKEQKEKIFNTIFDLIESGKSLRYALLQIPLSSKTFYEWIEEDEDKVKRYEKATDLRADILFDEIIDIAYNTEEGTTTKMTDRGVEVTTGDMLGHRRLKIDALKWSLSKLNPKKYGEKVQQEHSGQLKQTIISLGNGANPNETSP